MSLQDESAPTVGVSLLAMAFPPEHICFGYIVIASKLTPTRVG